MKPPRTTLYSAGDRATSERMAYLPDSGVMAAACEPRPIPGPVLRGRDAQLEAIGEGLAAAVAGRGGVLLLEGPQGIGKSILMSEARRMARRVGVRPVSGQAVESQRLVPFASLLDAMLDGERPILEAEVVRAIGNERDLRYWMVHELQGAIEGASRETPLMILLDDLQWADTATLAALGRLPPRLSRTSILWILAMRRREGRAALHGAMTRLEREGARRLVVGPLSDDAMAAILADVLEADADEALLELTAGAGGNPLLLVELLRGLREEGRLDWKHGRAVVLGRGLPRRLTDSVRERLERLSPDARQMVTVAAALGPTCTAEQLASMLQRRPSMLVAALAEAGQADFLAEAGDRLGFRHQLVREAVLETLPRCVRRALRREAAGVLLDSGVALVEAAMDLADSAEIGDAQAVATLRQAARGLASSDASAAAELSMRALELLPERDGQRGDLIGETVALLQAALRCDDARTLGERALSEAISPEHEAAIRLSLSRLPSGSREDPAAHNRRALKLPKLPPTMRARHQASLAFHLATAGRLAEATSAASSVHVGPDAGQDGQAHAMATAALAVVDRQRCAASRALERLESVRALESAPLLEPSLAVVDVLYAHTLADLGRTDDALSVVARRAAESEREHNPWLTRTWAHAEGVVRLMAGHLAGARAAAQSAPSAIERVAEAGRTPAMDMLTSAEVALHTGDTVLLKASVEAARAAYTSPSRAGHAVWVLVLAAVAREDWTDAIRWLRDDKLPSGIPILPDPGCQPLIARVALAAGDRELAHRAVGFAETFARESPGVPILAAIAAQTRGLLAPDSDELVQAAAMLGGTQRPLLFASACEDAGRALAREGRIPDAIARLSDALDSYLELEATADARRVSRLLRHHGVRRPIAIPARPQSGWGSLTDSELRVVRVIVTGATNRDAAKELFLSPHTVSTHLRHTFEKLGINSRIELAQIAMRKGESRL